MSQDTQLNAVIDAMTAPGQQFETQQTAINGVAYTVFKNAPPALATLFGYAMQHKDLDFIVYRDERYTFGETYARAQAFAAALQQDHGVAKGDRVIIAMRNYPEFVFSYMAIAMIGAVAVPVNAWWQAEELGYAAADSGAKVAICDGPRATRMAEIPAQDRPKLLAVRVSDIDAPGPAEILKESVFTSERTPQPVDIQPEDDLSILYTSGSTGAPKGAVSTQRGTITGLMGYACHGLAIRQLDGVASESVQPAVLLTVPLFHVTGLIPVCLISFFIGRKLVMMHKWDAGDALALMEQEKVTYFVGVPTMSLELMQHPERDKYDLSVLEDIAAGGAARPADHVARLKQTFPQARPGLGYGLTETNALGCINTRASYIAKPGSTGVVSRPAVELKIADEEGVALQTGEIGEVCLKSAANVRGYWNRPDETAAAFTEDGWFKTGDLGRLDEDGYLFIVDRKKDIIIRGGENISCLEVEDALFNHPKVAEACVFGLPDERLGEMVAAVIMPVDGADLSAEDMQAFVAEHLARFKVPQHVWIATKSLPRLATGKFDKRSLKAAYADILQAS